MKTSLLQQAAQFYQNRRRKQLWYRVVSGMACVVVFCTVYALILPAITLEKEPLCGLEEHTHTEDCYTAQTVWPSTEYLCDEESLLGHTHDETCYDEDDHLICGYADFVVHTHDDSCNDRNGDLVCPLPEIEEHEHGKECYRETSALTCGQEETGHIHGSTCYTRVRGELSCGMEEFQGHTHGSGCYETEQTLACTQEEGEDHTHDESCYKTREVLTCELEESAGHAHTDDCYEWTEELSCGREEDLKGHIHSADCYTTVTELICGEEEITLHTHDEGCFDEDENLICGKLQVLEHRHDESCAVDLEGEAQEVRMLTCGKEEHTHSDACYEEEVPLNSGTVEQVYICGLEEHTHDETCYDESGELICELEEHVHGLDCLTEEDRTRVEETIARIDELPSSEEIEETLAAYDEAGNEDGFEAYFEEVSRQVRGTYIQYEALGPELYALVSNREKLLELEWLWSAMSYATTDTVNVTAVNSFNWSSYGGALIVHNDNGTTVANAGMGEKYFKYWYAIRIEYEGNRYVVKEIHKDSGSSKANVYASGSGFILLYYPRSVGTVTVNLRDTATVSSDFWKTTKSYTGTVHGTVKFASASAQKTAKDNSGQLHKVNAASTRDFIELNLYDYGSGSTGRNINDKFNEDKKMPGFQQSGGTNNIASLDNFKSTGYMNFGDIVTNDLADGRLVTLASENPQGINVVQDTANSPISRYSDVMSKSLVNGYPALADGTSLGYLFGAENYSKQMNSQSIDGLFQYDEETGAYSFNSRENFAQFNSGKDTFTLYQEIFTPNFIMYPFGNFMPFNDIVHDSKKVSDINEDYFNELYLQANYLYQQGRGDQYAQLAKVLGQFLDYAQQDNWGADWTAKRALQHYFYWGCTEDGSGDLPPFDDAGIPLGRLYSLDYDVPSDFYFGMEMKMNFMQPKGGLTGKDGQQPMVFYFTGDDDVWVYIDGKLFLDLSGIHRHVGGEIDFVNGVVKYYRLETKTGDVSKTPYKTVKFSELVDASLLNSKGTFQDYSTHSFNFYYMERGSGSSVCRLNFNFPLLRKNSISVSKETTPDDGTTSILGSPDYYFNIIGRGATSEELLIEPGTTYDILDSAGNKRRTGTVDQYGIFSIKAGETAVFAVPENAGRYYVQELIKEGEKEQYDDAVGVNGEPSVYNSLIKWTEEHRPWVKDTGPPAGNWYGYNGPWVNASDSHTFVFKVNNTADVSKLGSLEITKVVTAYQRARTIQQFDFEVTLDGQPLPVGTAYMVGAETRKVTEKGIITLAAGETAQIAHILTGSRFTVQETAASAGGYYVTYSGSEGVDTTGGLAKGVIAMKSTVSVTVTNGEKGASVDIPFTKTLHDPDGKKHSYTFLLEQVTDASGETAAEPSFRQELAVQVDGTEPVQKWFSIDYPQTSVEGTVTYYYRITELVSDAESGTAFDPSRYVVAVTVTKSGSKELTAAVTGVWKDGTVQALEEDIAFVNTILHYELPETGGTGTHWYTLGGLCLMAGALLLLYRTKTRGKGGKEYPC